MDNNMAVQCFHTTAFLRFILHTLSALSIQYTVKWSSVDEPPQYEVENWNTFISVYEEFINGICVKSVYLIHVQLHNVNNTFRKNGRQSVYSDYPLAEIVPHFSASKMLILYFFKKPYQLSDNNGFDYSFIRFQCVYPWTFECRTKMKLSTTETQFFCIRGFLLSEYIYISLNVTSASLAFGILSYNHIFPFSRLPTHSEFGSI